MSFTLDHYKANINSAWQLNVFLIDIKTDALVKSKLMQIKTAIVMNSLFKLNIGKAVIKLKDIITKMGIIISKGKTRNFGVVYRRRSRNELTYQSETEDNVIVEEDVVGKVRNMVIITKAILTGATIIIVIMKDTV